MSDKRSEVSLLRAKCLQFVFSAEVEGYVDLFGPEGEHEQWL